MPNPLTTFIGRENEAATVKQLLTTTRLLTLTGTGGTGKTRLALHIAAELQGHYADGVFFVPLATIREPDLVLPAIAQALGIHDGEGQQLADRLASALRDRHMLLLLDNFEQVSSAAPQITAMLVACPMLHVLVTSRAPLHVYGEREFPVPPLAVSDPEHQPDIAILTQCAAVELFIQRAQAIVPDFRVTDATARAVAKICTRVDGLPLAIELAAARTKLLQPEEILARLGNRLTLLMGGGRDLPMRQQTMRHTIDWSYDLLDADEQTLFARLAVFGGGCTLGAIEAVCTMNGNTPFDVLDALASLVDQSLVRQTRDAEGEPRFGMLETIREYALERFAASSETRAVARAHATYFLALAERAEPKIWGPEQRESLEYLAQEHDNMRGALGWALQAGEAEIAIRLCSALWRFWVRRGYLREGRRWMDAALGQAPAMPPSLQARALYGAGVLTQQDDPAAARALFEGSLMIWRELEDGEGIALSLNGLGMVARDQCDFATARPLLEEGVKIMREIDNKVGLVNVMSDLAVVMRDQGHFTKSYTLLIESLAIARETGHTRGIGRTLTNLAFVIAEGDGDDDVARGLREESLSLAEGLGDTHGVAACLEGLAETAARQGQTPRAALLWGAADGLRQAIGAPLSLAARAHSVPGMTAARAHLGDVAWTAAWEEGRTMSLHQAVAVALGTHPLERSAPQPQEATNPKSAYPAGLTIREVEVLRQVAAGHTNRQIADLLSLSERTVHVHVRNIFAKTHTDNRAGATAFAFRHGLA